MTVWRGRLDTTTHWALILTAGLTTFVLGGGTVPHFLMLLGLALNSIFMFIEGRRYQHLHHSRWRVSLLEHNYFAAHLGARQPVENTWRAQLRADLQHPHFTISHFLGIRLRLRRNYLLLFYFTTCVWLTKIFIHPNTPADNWELYDRLAVGTLFPSWFVIITATLFVGVVTLLAVLTPSEEALEDWSKLQHERFLERLDQSGAD